MAASPYRALAHHHQGNAGQALPETVSLIRSFNVETNPTRPMRPSPLTASTTIQDMPLDLVDRIRSFPLFVSAPDDFLVAIGKHLRPQVHSAHDQILKEGDDARAMYWLVRGAVAVTSRDGEAVYAELKPGAFFGEIGVLMDMPRTATIVARTKCLLVVLKKEDLQAELPRYPDMEKAIRQEAEERLAILNKKRQESGRGLAASSASSIKAGRGSVSGATHTSREAAPGEVATGEVGTVTTTGPVPAINSKKRKSPSPGAIEDPAAGSALGSGFVNIRKTLRELPLFSTLPADILHFLGLSAQPKMYTPFTDIIRQGTPGNEIFFIVRGEAEVIHQEAVAEAAANALKRMTRSRSLVRPRLRQGQYFGEVASLGMSPGRTATVRSITTVECLIIGGDALDELWRRCPPEIRLQVEETARKRYRSKSGDGDVEMLDVADKEEASERDDGHENSQAMDALGGASASSTTAVTSKSLPQVTFTTPSKPSSPVKDESEKMEPTDPDPYLSVDMENMRNRRRNSLAPPTEGTTTQSVIVNGMKSPTSEISPIKFHTPSYASSSDADAAVPSKRARTTLPQRPHPSPTQQPQRRCVLPDDLLVKVFQHADIVELLRLRAVCSSWRRILTESPLLCTHVDLSPHNRHVTDAALINVIAPFLGERPVSIDIGNCFHVTDEGFQALWRTCGKNVKAWRMRSVWDVSANQILDMSENAKLLEEIDWSNCRKVGDNLLARVVGWVVPEPPPAPPQSAVDAKNAPRGGKGGPNGSQQRLANPNQPPPGTVIGCPNLAHLNLSYCKHITDRSMAHLAMHASSRLRSLSLTRCTSITDAGFSSWAPFRFSQLSRLCLADCTYLSDAAIVALVHAAENLTHLDLSFCCALSDTATEVVALRLPKLRELRLAFCGSAVSDASLGCIALHLNELRGLSVRGCVRVTGHGVEAVLEGIPSLRWMDASQCRNLEPWVRAGGVQRWGYDDRYANGNGLPPQTPVPINGTGATTKLFPPPPSVAGPGMGITGMTAAAAAVGTPAAGAAASVGAGSVGMGLGMGLSMGVGMGLGGAAGRGGLGAAAGAGPGGTGASWRTRQPVRFIIEKGPGGLR